METTTVNGLFAYIITFPKNVRVTVEYVASQGAAHTWRINGQPAMGFEVNREHLIGGSIDLKQYIEWEDR